MKNKYINIKLEDLEGSFKVDLKLADMECFKRFFVEYSGHKYICSKIGDEEWKVQKIDEFPYVKLPDDFSNIDKVKYA